MKKLLIAAAIVCAAVTSQAVAVSWSSGEMIGPGLQGGWSGSAIGETDDYTTTLIFATDLAFTEVVATSPIVGFDSDSYAEGTTGDVFAKGGKYYGKATVVGADFTLASEIFTFEIDSGYAMDSYYLTVGEGGDGIELASGEDLDPEYGAWQASGWQAAAAPEPTSGLLLLLGVAGLALRRRRV